MVISQFSRQRLGAAVTLLVAASTCALAQQTPRAQHVPTLVRNGAAVARGAVDNTRVLQLGFNLPLRDEAALDALLAQINDPSSPEYHHYLSVEEFTNRFGPTQQQYDEVVHWVVSHGFTVTGVTKNRLLVNVAAPVESVNRALHIQLTNFQHPTSNRTFFAPDRQPSLDLGVPLLEITGLNNAVPKQAHSRRDTRMAQNDAITHSAAPAPLISGSGPNNTYLPNDMRAAYYGSGPLTGAGQTVAIFSYDGYLPNDLQVYTNNTGFSWTVPVRNVLVAGYNGACFGFNTDGSVNPNTCDDGEQILDIVNVIGMAPGLTQVLFYEGNSSASVLNQMATDNVAKVISSSWGGGDFGSSSVQYFKEFQAQGISYLNATGDFGAFNSSTYAPPSTDPNITQVGGTHLNTNGSGGSWQSETAWADSGGGYVSGTPIPSYQQLSGVINSSNRGSTSLRNAPDVAAEADYDNPTASNGQFLTGYGGTSFATPRWAGLIALANQQAVQNGKPTLGFLNSMIYNLGVSSSYTANFHDITSGSNPATKGSSVSFNAVARYDLVTGWGSPQGPTLIATFAGGSSGTPTPDYSLSTNPASLTIAPSASGTATVTVNDLSGFSGAVSFSASGLPSGVTATFNPTSSATSTVLTLSASSTAVAGTSTITITGTSGSLTHTVTLALTISSGGTPVQLIANSGFEAASASPWNLSSGVLCTTSTCSGETPHSGNGFAWLDGYGSTHTDTASQNVTIPAGRTKATLSFYLHIDTAETTTSTAYDTLRVQLLNSSGAVLTTLATFSNLNKVSGYAQHSYDLSKYIGSAVTLKLTGSEDSSLQTSFVLDDVTLTVQ